MTWAEVVLSFARRNNLTLAEARQFLSLFAEKADRLNRRREKER